MAAADMDYQGFITTVREGAHIQDEEAERAACATLQTLAERLTAGETEDLAERLPGELHRCLAPEGTPPEPFHVDEFLRRVATRAGVDHGSAERDARAVFVALWSAVGPDEFADMRAQLPNDFDPLLDEALREAPPPPAVTEPPLVDAMPYAEFVRRVAERAGLNPRRAEQPVEAVLEVLAMRITAGQVEDLERVLAPELRVPLERGRRAGPDAASPLTLDAFLHAVARREGVSLSEATEHARAVLRTLREAVGEKEFHDTAEQLPDDYRTLWKQG